MCYKTSIMKSTCVIVAALVAALGTVESRAAPQAPVSSTDGNAMMNLGRMSLSASEVLQRAVDRGEIPGAISMVSVSGKVEVAYVGLADPKTGRKPDEHSFFWIASMSKGMCGAAVMSCVDKGLVHLDDPVEKYIPELARLKVVEKGVDGRETLRAPKTKITLRMCLSHVAGFPLYTPREQRESGFSFSLAEYAAATADCRLLRDPLTKHQYSNVDINLAGRVVEIVTGMPFEVYLQKTFFDPLGMTSATFYPTAEQLRHRFFVARVAKGRPYEDGRKDHWAKPLEFGERVRGRDHANAAGGVFATAGDVMKFYMMLANDGWASDGTRILSHASILALSTAQYPSLDRYTLGLRQYGDWFGHDGALQTEAYANWKENRVALLYIQVTGEWNSRFKQEWRAAAMRN